MRVGKVELVVAMVGLGGRKQGIHLTDVMLNSGTTFFMTERYEYNPGTARMEHLSTRKLSEH